jgi:hypothetical protein
LDLEPLIRLRVERHPNRHPRVVFHTPLAPLLLALIVHVHRVVPPRLLAQDLQAPAALGHELLEHLGKVLGDGLEGALDGLVLAGVEDLDQLVDRLARLVKLLLPSVQLVALLGERRVLPEKEAREEVSY